MSDLLKSGGANFLDGSPVCPRQTQEGKNDDELEQEALSEFKQFILGRYGMYSKYITYPEMLHLWDCENEAYLRTMPTRERIMMRDKEASILAKIDQQEVFNMLEKRLIDLRSKKKVVRHASYELGAREFTFTYSPKWFNDDEARLKMKIAIDKLSRYYKNEIVRLRAVGEVGTNGLSHVHCYYQLRGGLKISDKNFRRAYPPWDTSVRTSATGHKGGHHANIRCSSDFQGYIEKDIASAWLDVNINNEDPE